ncbi:YwpF family protein [Alteribacillus bidgolensis]|uniref:YwpF-like protein n=1 Tax=Alteribacillus bidgolensis TaxID=930129 RepID=A0A1G8ENJ7_9BACI|nr:YwpF family protein [Alteribacillus bidgolensis]SDH71422.1 YwpF-like protein [Alteribacillus bidgolensis]
MKTFQLVSLQVLLFENEKVVHRPVPVQEGLIINREESQSTWLIEAVIPTDQKKFLEQIRNKTLVFEVVITESNNDPALMTGEIRDFIELSDTYSLMIDAKMAAGKDDVSNLILDGLIQDDYSGDELLNEFIYRKGDQVAWSKKLAENIYKDMK